MDHHIDTLKSSQVPPDSPRKPVKSTAVVKYSAVQTPAMQCNTDLNLPPSNWLSSSAESYGLQNDWSQKRSFSSFRRTYMFPDCVEEVDVVSEAKNIKKHLKMHHTEGVISMVVYRVEIALLLDDLDVYRYILRQAGSDCVWLKKFVCQQVFQNYFPNSWHMSSRTTTQQENLLSKFLYHSLVFADKMEQNENLTLPVKTLEQSFPEPSGEEELPEPNCSHNFARNVFWTFQNIQMLVGTDMPIFGSETHPCISLRLRDMTKPISVLTGIDYWLDNLMSNVPEVAMCCHLDGIVQKYELIRNEDLPDLEDTKFSPKVIRDFAQSILSFLKNNATKSGHTYWLFKGKDDYVVKLYDLTSLCGEVNDDKGQSSFTVPVAKLLYRVARNMKYSLDYCTKRGTIRMLLKNCILLLAEKKYPETVTSAYSMLSDLYVPAGTNLANPVLMDQSDDDDSPHESCLYQENDKDSENKEEDVSSAIETLTLTKINEQSEYAQFKYKPPPITGTLEERCKVALEHVASGVECLNYFPIQEDSSEKEEGEEKKQRVVSEEDVPQIAKPFQAIPMPCTPLNEPARAAGNNPSYKMKNKQKKSKKSAKKASITDEVLPKPFLCKPSTLPASQAPKKSVSLSWNAHLKTLLYEKASLVLGVLAANEDSNGNYGASLRYISIGLRCQKILDVFCRINDERMTSYFFGRAGDCGFMTVQDWVHVEKHRQDYEAKSETSAFTDEICSMEELENSDPQLLPQRFESPESTLIDSLRCYEKALTIQQPSEDRDALLRRVGNIHNELGILYMNQAIENEDSTPSSLEGTALLERSQTYLEAGVKFFKTIREQSNLALLYTNVGRLSLLRAHMHAKQPAVERQFYEKALTSYQKALQVLGVRKRNPTIWDNVTWDFSTTLYTMANCLQDYPVDGNKSEEELEREAVTILQKALKYCEAEIPGPRQPIYQFRAATIHHRLASLYHRMYTEHDAENEIVRRKTSLQLCKLNYEKASKLFSSLKLTQEYLTVQMGRVALAGFQAQGTSAISGKLKFYKIGLDLILQCRPAIDVCEKNKNDSQIKGDAKLHSSSLKNKADVKENEDEKINEDEFVADEESLIILLEKRLQFFLHSLIILNMDNKSTGTHKKYCDNLATLYKQCYSLTLRKESFSGINLFRHIAKTLLKIEELLKQHVGP